MPVSLPTTEPGTTGMQVSCWSVNQFACSRRLTLHASSRPCLSGTSHTTGRPFVLRSTQISCTGVLCFRSCNSLNRVIGHLSLQYLLCQQMKCVPFLLLILAQCQEYECPTITSKTCMCRVVRSKVFHHATCFCSPRSCANFSLEPRC
jgi:hypothetical protein